MLISIMHTVTSALQVPVVALLMALAVLAVVMLGMLVAEFFTERRYFKLSIPDLVDDLQHSDDPETVVRESGMLRRQKKALYELLNHPDATASERESMAVNIVSQEQAIFDNRVKVTDFIAKVGPMLGLMGTLIPLGPGIIAIGAGDTQMLSESLLVAFDTTVTGLVVAAIALLVSTIRKSWYAKYNAAFAAACEVVLEKANEGAVLAGAASAAAKPGAGPVGAAQPAAQAQARSTAYPAYQTGLRQATSASVQQTQRTAPAIAPYQVKQAESRPLAGEAPYQVKQTGAPSAAGQATYQSQQPSASATAQPNANAASRSSAYQIPQFETYLANAKITMGTQAAIQPNATAAHAQPQPAAGAQAGGSKHD